MAMEQTAAPGPKSCASATTGLAPQLCASHSKAKRRFAHPPRGSATNQMPYCKPRARTRAQSHSQHGHLFHMGEYKFEFWFARRKRGF